MKYKEEIEELANDFVSNIPDFIGDDKAEQYHRGNKNGFIAGYSKCQESKDSNEYRMSVIKPVIEEMHGWANFSHYVLVRRKEEAKEFEELKFKYTQAIEDMKWIIENGLPLITILKSNFAVIRRRHGLVKDSE